MRYDWHSLNAGSKPHNVGELLANPWGLYDTHGNVCEWCVDGYVERLPGGIDPIGDPESRGRAYRGGSWFSPPQFCRSAKRGIGFPISATRSWAFGWSLSRTKTTRPLPDEASPNPKIAPSCPRRQTSLARQPVHRCRHHMGGADKSGNSRPSGGAGDSDRNGISPTRSWNSAQLIDDDRPRITRARRRKASSQWTSSGRSERSTASQGSA